MMDIPDAPWIQEAMRTGHCRSGWWNWPPEDSEGDEEEEGGDDDDG